MAAPRTPAQGCTSGQSSKRNPPSQGVSDRAEGCVARGKPRHKRCLLDTGRPPGVRSQAPDNRGSVRVRTLHRDTRGTKMETINELNIPKEIPEELATSCGKSPEKMDVESATKTRARYSGAARRRYKKQLREGSKADPVTGTGEQASAAACKRPRQEPNTPSPNEKKQSEKRPKIADQRTYSQAAAGIVRVALVPESYPDKQLSKEEAEELKELVEGQILGLPKGTKAPTFKGTSERDGAVIFNCTDEETGGWLKSLTSETKLKNGMLLRALRVDELPKRHRVVVHVEHPKKPVNEILDLIDKQNPGVGDDWVVARGSESRDAKSTHFAALIREGSLRALVALNFKPFCGLGQATVRLVGGDRREEEKKGDKPESV